LTKNKKLKDQEPSSNMHGYGGTMMEFGEIKSEMKPNSAGEKKKQSRFTLSEIVSFT
jgi:hypothetical protein